MGSGGIGAFPLPGIKHLRKPVRKTAEKKCKIVAHEKNKGEIAQPAAGSDFLCAVHLLIIADRSRVRRSSGNS
jgi:hypothetical protein